TVYNSQHGLFGHQVLSIHEDCDQNLWIGTWGGGLYRYKNGKFNAFTTKQGLTSNIVRVITQDREKNLWIGTSGAGLNRLKNRRFFTYTTKHGLSNNVIRTVFQAKNGKLWIGTDGGGLNSFWEGRFSVFSTDNGLSNNVVRSILEDRQGNLWIGTYGGGLNKFFRGKFTTYTTEEGLSGNYILSLVEDRAGNIWAGTWGDGLNRIRDGKISIITMKKGLSNDNVMVLHEDRQGKLWIGTGGGGLNCWENGNFVIYTTRQGLAGNYILAIYEDNEGTLWIGTYNNGLSRFKAGQFTSYSSKDGLYNDTVFQILEDDRENLWMSCSKGIFRISKKELNQFATGKRRSINSFFYNQSDGMESCECNGSGQPSGIKSKDGALWFPTVKGVVTINPSQVQSNTITPPVVIERIKIDEKFIDPKKVKEFSPGKKIFEFHYTALSYTSPQKIRFRYKLDPFNQKWVDAGSRRIAYYTNIPAGEYRFNVIACNSDGVWNTTGASFKFVYKPYFYQTFWFYLLAVIMVVAGTITIHLFRIRQIIIRERRKYEKSRVPVEDAEKYLTKLIQFMETQKSYLDPGINLHRLSKKLMIPDHYISQIINTKLKQNFFDFINSYRIEEAKRRISSSDFQNMSFLQIAFDVGFNSKSAFNRAFKKHTAMTPSEYKKIINHTK
ncbi:MAG: helix-turn-helix domain-containing protein, partial [Candidatus Aminicenantes bacterium]|nr:helix-turn-helix domain-containing protein [Candidatus Aminicenantes bacterium]